MSHPLFTVAAEKALNHLRHELSGLRTGRANPSLIESLPVECYGSTSTLQQVAAISAPEPRLLVVQPWDPSVIKDIEKSINQSNVGINPVVDGKLIRLPIPPMTAERRADLLKIVHSKAEEAKVRLRIGREEAMKALKEDEKTGTKSADAVATAMKQVQQALDEATVAITEIVEQKTEELNTI